MMCVTCAICRPLVPIFLINGLIQVMCSVLYIDTAYYYLLHVCLWELVYSHVYVVLLPYGVNVHLSVVHVIYMYILYALLSIIVVH